MNTHTIEKDGISILELSGELSIYAVSDLKKDLDSILSETTNEIHINLIQVSRIDTAGIQVLIALKKECIRNNRTIKIIDHSEPVIACIELYGLMGYFGDPIKLSKSLKDTYPFHYGRKKGFY